MEIFNNQQRSGYEEIVSYGPKWWTEFREMDANYRFAGWTLDLMAYWLERVVNNQFPANADERTITTVFEPALRIEPEPDETLEERRKTAAAYWSGTGKLSKTVIQSIIKAYTAARVSCGGMVLSCKSEFSATRTDSFHNGRSITLSAGDTRRTFRSRSEI